MSNDRPKPPPPPPPPPPPEGDGFSEDISKGTVVDSVPPTIRDTQDPPGGEPGGDSGGDE